MGVQADKIRKDYQLMEALFASQGDFIVLGLCGKTGSGSTTAADILKKRFDELQLPIPGYGGEDLYSEHEYRILYTYAKKHWKPFHEIKSSALIMAHVLEEGEDFVKKLIPEESDERITKAGKAFIEAKMEIDLQKWFAIDVESASAEDGEQASPYLKYFAPDADIEIGVSENEQEQRVRIVCHKEHRVGTISMVDLDVQSMFEYVNGAKFVISNKDLYRLFVEYKRLREEKSNFENPIYYWILKEYIYDFLPAQVKRWRDAVAAITKGLPNLVMQLLGINLRIFKKAIPGEWDKFDRDGFTIIAEEINLAIKLLRTYQNRWFSALSEEQKFKLGGNAHKHTLVVVDSIKNPFESMYLKQRYSNYYLLGIYTEDWEREHRLLKVKKFTQKEIEEVNQIELLTEFQKVYEEYTGGEKGECDGKRILGRVIEEVQKSKLEKELAFILQNVASCLESADIFINNSQDNEAHLTLKKVLLKYVCLIMHPGLVLPTPIERCMQIAYTAKLNSGCISRQVGAVITDSGYHLLSVGWNQQPEEQLPCSYRNLCELVSHWSTAAYSDFENDDNDDFQVKLKDRTREVYDSEDNPLCAQGRLPNYCFKDLYNGIKGKSNQVHPRSLHAEETAFLNLGPVGRSRVKEGCLFTTSSPCELCAKKAKYMGVSKIYYIELYSGISYKHVLRAGPYEKRPELILFTGSVGRAYMQLYTTLLPIKDEHEMWMGGKMVGFLLSKQK